MILGVPTEIREGERRVAATPDSIKKLLNFGVEIHVQSGAGAESSFPDDAYEKAGAKVCDREAALGADIVLKVAPPTSDEIKLMKSGALLVCAMDPFGEGKALMEELAAAGVSCVALELIPRISRAQSMDILSSQANIAGYRAVIEAAHHFGKLFPMMMTAAGSVPPAKAVVLGAGVAGLQAIATARRLGAQVEAFDVRPEVKEQIESVGAKFMDLGLEESGAGAGGYAKALSEEGQKKQKAALAKRLEKADIVISTAQIPGREAPELITEDALKGMKPGSVIVDMAAGSGGNCRSSKAGEVVVVHGVTLIGYTDLPCRLASHSSQFFARNLVSFLELVIQKAEGGPALKLDLEDEIIDGALVTNGSEKRWPKPKPE